MADKALRVVLVGDASSLQRALKAAEQAADAAKKPLAEAGETAQRNVAKIEGFGDALNAAFTKFAVKAAVLGTVVTGMRAVGEAVVGTNATLQTGAVAWGVLLGSADKAQAKLAELAKFAADTPFAFEEVDKASRLLQTFGGDLLNTGANLKMVGDIASGTGQPFSEVAMWVGRMYDAMQSGRPFGEASQRLQEMGALSGPARAQLEALQASGAKGPAIWAAFTASMGRYNGMMEEQAKTFSGQLSTLTDNLNLMAAEAGKPIFDALTQGIKALNKELSTPGGQNFITNLAAEIKTILAGHFIDQFGLDMAKSFFLIGDSFNQLLKGISGGKLNIDGPLRDFYRSINAEQGRLTAEINASIGAPIAAAVGGTAPGSPIAPAAMQAAGGRILTDLIRGMDSGQADAAQKIGAVFADLFKVGGQTDAGKLTEANIALAQALKETANGGQLTSETMYALSAAYQGQTPLVVQLIGAHNALTNAQNRQKDAAQGLADAQRGLEQVQNRAKGDLAGYEAAITSAQQAATAHAQATADALEPLQDALAGVRAAAEASGRDGAQVIAGLQGELEGLQNQASANAAAFQQQIDAAQAKYEAAQTRRQQLQGVLQAALNGEVEAYLRINDIQDESIRKIAEKWQAEIDGQRRAKEGADDKVKGLNRAANKEDLDYLQKIQAARAGGNEKEARRLERELAARQKQRQAAITLAQAEARVAGDNYDAAAEALGKEGKAQDEIEGKAEKAAAAEVTRIQTAAQAQKAADDAAIAAKNEQIKRVQAAQAAEQERYAAQQRGIQAEIDKINDAAKATAKKDAADLLAAQTLYTQRQTYWNLENTGAQTAVNLFGAFATNTTTIANDSKAAYDQLEKITKLDFQNVIDAAAAAKTLPGVNGNPPVPTQNGTPLAPAPQSTPGQTEGQIGPPGAAPGAQGPANMPPLLEGAPGATPPPGYHSEVDNGGNFWFVPNGYSLLNYGKQQGPGANSGNGGDSTSMSASSIGGPSFLRAAGVGGASTSQLRAGDEGGGITVNIHAPNLRDIGSKADQHDLAAIMRRELSSAMRGGLDPGRVGA